MAEQGSDNPNTDASVAELARQLSERTTRLARQEVALAKPNWRRRANGPASGPACWAAPAWSDSTPPAR